MVWCGVVWGVWGVRVKTTQACPHSRIPTDGSSIACVMGDPTSARRARSPERDSDGTSGCSHTHVQLSIVEIDELVGAGGKGS